MGLIALAVWISIKLSKGNHKTTTNLNMMNTMLLGGMWHGASWNFIIWGGLNGLGILVYKYWKNRSIYARMAILSVALAAAGVSL